MRCLVLGGEEHVGESNNDEPEKDEQDAEPADPAKLVAEDQTGENSGEDDDRASEHLEGAGGGEGEPDVHQRGGAEVEQSLKAKKL